MQWYMQQVLAFSTQVHNIGCAPFVIGVPSGYEPGCPAHAMQCPEHGHEHGHGHGHGMAWHVAWHGMCMACAWHVHSMHTACAVCGHATPLLSHDHSEFDTTGNACRHGFCGRRLSSDGGDDQRKQQNLSRGGGTTAGRYPSHRRLDNVHYIGMA